MGKIQLFLNNFYKMTFEGKGAFWGICLALLLLALTYIYSEKLRDRLKEKSKFLFVVPVLLLAGFVGLFIRSCNYVPISERTAENPVSYEWEQKADNSRNSMVYTTDVKNPATGKAYEQTYSFIDIANQLTITEEADHVGDTYTIVSDDKTTEMIFNPDGTYRFHALESDVEETGTYTFVKNKLTMVNDIDGSTIEVKTNSTKTLRYKTQVADPATNEAFEQKYAIKDLKNQCVAKTTIPCVEEAYTVTSTDESTSLTFNPDGTYQFRALDSDVTETGHYIYNGNELTMANAEGSAAFQKNFWSRFGWLIFALLVAVAMALIFVFNPQIKKFMNQHPMVWLLIPAALLIYFVYVAIGWNIWVSVSDWQDESLTASYGWGGFGQYTKMFHEEAFWGAVLNTLKLFLIIPICLVLGMGLALIMDQGLKGTPVFRTLILLPFALSFVVTGLIWQQMFNGTGGILVEFLKLLGINSNVLWKSNELVMFSLMIIMTWQFSGYVAVIFLAAIKNVPTNIINAAKLDGSYMPRVYWKMIIPQLKGAMGSCITILAMYALRSFDLIISFDGYTNPATTTLPLMMYNEAFQKNNFAYAAAISFLLAMVLALILPLTYLTNRRKR